MNKFWISWTVTVIVLAIASIILFFTNRELYCKIASFNQLQSVSVGCFKYYLMGK